MIKIKPNPHASLAYLDVLLEFIQDAALQDLVDDVIAARPPHPQRSKQAKVYAALCQAIASAGHTDLQLYLNQRNKKVA